MVGRLTFKKWPCLIYRKSFKEGSHIILLLFALLSASMSFTRKNTPRDIDANFHYLRYCSTNRTFLWLFLKFCLFLGSLCFHRKGTVQFLTPVSSVVSVNEIHFHHYIHFFYWEHHIHMAHYVLMAGDKWETSCINDLKSDCSFAMTVGFKWWSIRTRFT